MHSPIPQGRLEEFADYLKWGFVRNPYDRWRSWWQILGRDTNKKTPVRAEDVLSDENAEPDNEAVDQLNPEKSDITDAIDAAVRIDEIEKIFQDEPLVLDVLKLKMAGHTLPEIESQLNLSRKQVQAINKKIQRKAAPFRTLTS
jgi:DNA-directed RNA polymerase specialized sigma subunit